MVVEALGPCCQKNASHSNSGAVFAILQLIMTVDVGGYPRGVSSEYRVQHLVFELNASRGQRDVSERCAGDWCNVMHGWAASFE